MEAYEFQVIDNEMDAKTVSDDIFKNLTEAGLRDQKSQKEMINQLFNKVFDNLTSKSSIPVTKYTSLLILRDIFETSLRPEKKISKVFTLLLSHKLFKQLQTMCESIDPYKSINDKGKAQYPADPVSGNNIVRLCLELVKFLAYKFPKNKNLQITIFNKVYNKLCQKKVVFPGDYRFISPSSIKATVQKQQNGMLKTDRKQSSEALPPPSSSRPSRQSQFNYICSKIKIFLRTLEEEDDQEYLFTQIKKTNQIIKKQSEKIGQSVTEMMSNNTDNDLVNRFIDAKDFMDKQIEFYDTFLVRERKLAQYIASVLDIGRKYFPNQSVNKPVTPGYNQGGQSSNKLQKKVSSKLQNRVQSKIQNKQEIKVGGFDSKDLNSIGRYFERVQERSKSPIAGGFRKINESLSRQKAKNSTIKSKVGPLQRTNFNKSINSLQQSKIAAIFSNPPNQNPPARHYEGQQIPENYGLNNSMLLIDKNQGHRRFKTANFKGKSSLYQSEYMQIGYKSQAIYEQISGFRVLLKIQLFIGNLCEDNIRNLSLQFKGDQNVLLYANPKTIQSTLVRGQQSKVQLVIIPLKPQFPLLTINVRYTLPVGQQQFQIILPNSALKFAHFLQITKRQFVSRWSTAQLYKTTQFPLSHYLPPDTLIRWIPSLSELITYTSYVIPGTKNDYELFTTVIMMQKYEALLKINIRPNLNVVIQLGVQDRNEEANGYFATFLQHLQQFMKENR